MKGLEKIIICRCEEVDLEEIRQTVSQYGSSARETKLRTRAGMGYCGGRICRPMLDAILKKIMGDKPQDQIPLKIQPPVRPVTLARLGDGLHHDD